MSASRIAVVGNRKIGRGEPVFVIAEAGVNHNGNLNDAKRLIEVAFESRADAVKFQTFHAQSLVTATAPKAAYQVEATDSDESQLDMLQRLELTPEDHHELAACCRKLGIIFLSTPFDEAAADFLDKLGVPAFKIGSGDLTNVPLIKHVARKGKPMIISTGMSTLEEVAVAVEAAREAGCEDLILLHCVSNYPAAPADVNLRAMQTMEETFHLPVGYSDHTPRLEVALAAVTLGACVIEKHFTLDRTLPGPDHRASLVPEELNDLIKSIRNIEAALGDGEKKPAASERAIAEVARRSLVASQDIAAGTVLTSAMIEIKRPGTGLSPRMLPNLIGHKIRFDLQAGELFTLEMIEDSPSS